LANSGACSRNASTGRLAQERDVRVPWHACVGELHPGILDKLIVRDCARRADRDGAGCSTPDGIVSSILRLITFIEVVLHDATLITLRGKDVEAGLPHEIVPLCQNC